MAAACRAGWGRREPPNPMTHEDMRSRHSEGLTMEAELVPHTAAYDCHARRPQSPERAAAAGEGDFLAEESRSTRRASRRSAIARPSSRGQHDTSSRLARPRPLEGPAAARRGDSIPGAGRGGVAAGPQNVSLPERVERRSCGVHGLGGMEPGCVHLLGGGLGLVHPSGWSATVGGRAAPTASRLDHVTCRAGRAWPTVKPPPI